LSLKKIGIKATSLSDAWYQSLFNIVDKGRSFIIDRGSNAGQKRLEFDYFSIQITHPGAEPLLPTVREGLSFPNPVDPDYLDDYLPYLMTDADKPGESYTYGQRICKAFLRDFEFVQLRRKANILLDELPELEELGIFTPVPFGWIVNQMDLMIWTYKNKGYRNNQMIMQVGQPSDMVLQDPPCLRHIDTRIQDGKLHFFPYFSSWDLFGGFPANLAAIEMMKQFCAAQIGVENGEIIASSKGLHIYDYVFEISEAIRGNQIYNSGGGND
jgi:thymidylate synthase